MRKIVILVAVLALCVAGGLSLWYARAAGGSHSAFRTEKVEREDLMASFTATGTLEPEDIVDVGAQVAGQIKEFGTDARTKKPIDYASDVEAGALLAKIDDSLYSAKVKQSEAMVSVAKEAYKQALAKVDDAKSYIDVAQANLQTSQVNLDHAQRDWDRAQALSPKQALAPADYDTYRSTFESSRAAVNQSKAALAQAQVQVREAEAAADNAKASIGAAEAQLAQDKINLGYTEIKAPVKGVIIDRRVTIGQTVQSSFNTPSLFLLARDLRRMKVWASVNEADVGHVHVGQKVSFTCDAFAGETFTGTVGLIRLNATMTNNVVTYTVEVLTDNPVDKDHPNGKLYPYLTANLKFEVDRREGALTVSNEALRWKPDPKQVAPDARAALAAKGKGRPDAGEGGKPKDAGAKAGNYGTVWVEDGQYVRPVRVKLGLTDGNRTEILDGKLEDGAVIVTGDALVAAEDGGSNPFAPQVFGKKQQ